MLLIPELKTLAAAIDQRSRDVLADDDARADAKDLTRALARLLLGQTIRAAFGSPGDWGYNTPIGTALSRVYTAGAERCTLVESEARR